MKEKLKEFVAAKRAVSPVIGVVLMVAVVVILAAVIGAFVLGLGGSQDTAPQAAFTYNEEAGTNGAVVMSSGEPIDPANLFVKVGTNARTGWTNVGGGATVEAGSAHSLTTAPAAGDTIKIIYDDGTGNTATLATIQV